MNEKVTAYIIFYNNEDTIKDSISSLLNQTVHIDQIILIDDGSRDNSYNEAASFNLPIIKNTLILVGDSQERLLMSILKVNLFCPLMPQIYYQEILLKMLFFGSEMKM